MLHLSSNCTYCLYAAGPVLNFFSFGKILDKCAGVDAVPTCDCEIMISQVNQMLL